MSPSTTAPKSRIKGILILGFLLIPIALFLYYCVEHTPPVTGHVKNAADAPIDGLPSDASNVYYYLRGLGGKQTAYHFKTSEESFRAWVADKRLQNVSLGPLKEGTVSTQKYRQPTNEWLNVHIQDGLHTYAGDDGEAVYYVYDRENHTAYYYLYIQ